MNGAPELSNLFQPLLDTLAARHGWVVCAVTWVGALRTAFKPVSGKIGRYLDRAVARVAETEDPADDLVLQRMLSSRWYRVLAFTLDLIASIKLPLTLKAKP